MEFYIHTIYIIIESLKQFLIEKYKILVNFILFLSFKRNLRGVNTTYQSNINSMLFNPKLSQV